MTSRQKIAIRAIKMLGGFIEATYRLQKYERPGRPMLTNQALHNWPKRGIPPEWCVDVEKELGGRLTRSDFRPEIFPPEEYPSGLAHKKVS